MVLRRLFLTLVVSLGPGSAWAANLSGTWTITGPIQPICTITQSGSQLSGNCKGPVAEGPLEGSSDGQTVQFIFRRTGPTGGQLAPVRFVGTVNGDSMTGTLAVGQNVGNPFTAHREGTTATAAPQPAPVQQTRAASPPPSAINNAPPRTVWDSDMDGSAIIKSPAWSVPAPAATSSAASSPCSTK